METATEKEHRINHEIRSATVRLITDEGEQLGVIPLSEALRRAEIAELDLVEVSAGKDAPVCKIMDYGKFKYRQTKRAHEAKQKQKVVQIKEIKIRPQTDDGDYQTKLRNIIRFLEEGDKCKISLRFRGREIVHADLGMKMMDRLKTDTVAYAVVEFQPRLEGRQMVMVLAPMGKASKSATKSSDKKAEMKSDSTRTPKTEAPTVGAGVNTAG